MEQENYKAIAEIIKTYTLGKTGKDEMELVDAFADYFERKAKKPYEHDEGCLDSNVDKELPECICVVKKSIFNKEHFLKDCGVK